MNSNIASQPARAHHDTDTRPQSLRLWPAVAAVLLQWFFWVVVPVLFPSQMGLSIFGGVGCGVVVFLWWMFFSRAPWVERIGAIALMVIAIIATSFVVHPSISNGFMGNLLYGYSVPAFSLALVATLVVTRGASARVRRGAVAVGILLACGSFTLLRTGGITGDAQSDLHWRWTPTPEERLLARTKDEPPPPPPATAPALPSDPAAEKATASASAAPAATTPPPAAASENTSRTRSAPRPADSSPATGDAVAAPKAPVVAERAAAPNMPAPEWPGFRGPERNSVVHGIRLDTDWAQSKPVQMWRHPIGPGWSSFAVQGNRVYTQEQRGEDEIVSCYDLGTGAPVWRHRDAARFWESNGGAGPRGTPTLSHGRLYAFGATGIVNALDAQTGAVVWTRNAAADTGAPMPGWGFTSSPLIVGDLVVIAASGRLVAYERTSGAVKWTAKTGGGSYSSPQLMTVDGVEQIVLLNGSGVTSLAPSDGAVLWTNAWTGVPIVQPALTPDGDVLSVSGDAMGGNGIRRLSITHNDSKWSVEERWTSTGLKPYFNDYVVHNGYVYGFDGSILACIDLKDGSRKWKGGRYGHGQFVLLPDQDLLLVLSEEGELALVSATPDKFTEIARAPAIEGKTWNHPVLVNDVLLVRNGEEMAAFRLSRAGDTRD